MYILDTKIVGGIEAWPHSHPYQVAIIIDTPKGQSFCGGAFVGKLLQKQSKVGIHNFSLKIYYDSSSQSSIPDTKLVIYVSSFQKTTMYLLRLTVYMKRLPPKYVSALII